jgi:hypothetical protein
MQRLPLQVGLADSPSRTCLAQEKSHGMAMFQRLLARSVDLGITNPAGVAGEGLASSLRLRRLRDARRRSQPPISGHERETGVGVSDFMIQ